MVVKGIVTSVALAAVAACQQGGQQQAAGGGTPPALPVGVIQAQVSPVGLSQNLPGRVEASRVAEIRARAAGILEKRLFKEGSDVKAGQVLFQIDPAPLRAAYNSAQAARCAPRRPRSWLPRRWPATRR
ncbi:biotin/lipoyl-binding protein [Lautropia mirabilis]